MSEKTIRASVRGWARELGQHHGTLGRKLRAAGVDVSLPTVGAADVFRAMLMDPAQVRAEKTREEIALLKIERAKKEGVLVEKAYAISLIAQAFGPVRQQFTSLPAAMATRVNPTDPEFARAALEEWRDGAMAEIRATLPREIGDPPAPMPAKKTTARNKAKRKKRKRTKK